MDSNTPYVYHNLARCFYYDLGTEENEETAFPYFYKAAQMDVDSSQYYVSYCYYWGHGVEKDHDKAFQWATRASKNGVPGATVILGLCYLYGRGVAQDVKRAREMLEKYVEDHPNGESYYVLGMIYDKGMDVPENMDTAVSYYQKAIEEGCIDAEEALAHFKKSLFRKWKRR